MHSPAFFALLFIAPTAAVRAGDEGFEDTLQAEGFAEASGGWDNKLDKVSRYLLQGLAAKELTGEFEGLAAVARELEDKKMQIQRQLLKNTYMKGPQQQLIVRFSEAKEKAEYKAVLGEAPLKLAVFDFDQTLSTGHFKPPQTTPEDILPDQRVTQLTEMFEHLRRNGTLVVVVTRNSAALVSEALAARLPSAQQQPFRVVGQEACNHFDWCIYDNPGPSSKADAIKKLFLDFWDMGWDRVLFADDDPSNCEDVVAKSTSQAKVLVVCEEFDWQPTGGRGDACKGLTDPLFQTIKDWADA